MYRAMIESGVPLPTDWSLYDGFTLLHPLRHMTADRFQSNYQGTSGAPQFSERIRRIYQYFHHGYLKYDESEERNQTLMNTSCEKPQLIPSSPYKEKIKRNTGYGRMRGKRAARERQQRLAKPAGSLGLLEDIAVNMQGSLAGRTRPYAKRAFPFSGADNGVYEEGVATAPQEFTRKLLLSYAHVRRCGINVICDANDVKLKLVNMGVKGGSCTIRGSTTGKLMDGTNNFAKGTPAMPRTIVEQAIQIGFDYAAWAKKKSLTISWAPARWGWPTPPPPPPVFFAGLDIRESRFVGTGAGLSPDGLTRKKSDPKRADFSPADPRGWPGYPLQSWRAGYCRDGRPVSRSRLLPNPGGRRWLDLNCGGPARQFPSAACPDIPVRFTPLR